MLIYYLLLDAFGDGPSGPIDAVTPTTRMVEITDSNLRIVVISS